MNNIRKNRPLLEALKTANPKLRTAILQNSDDKLVCVLVEIISNLLQGHINMNPHQKKKLEKYKNQFRKMVSCCAKHNTVINKRKARKMLIQSGGALPFLIPLLAPLIAKAALGGVVAASAGVATKKILGE